MSQRYNHKKTEAYWQNQWDKLEIFNTSVNKKKKKFFCQKLTNNQWVNITTKKDDNIKLENAILNRAKKLKLKSS